MQGLCHHQYFHFVLRLASQRFGTIPDLELGRVCLLLHSGSSVIRKRKGTGNLQDDPWQVSYKEQIWKPSQCREINEL